ncbi:Pentatricopeptide repeat-containing protein family [Quillaja saponaria]|uniref:Pentatricopeptide repeat-containing protein family n=1 Tax=Quillaja saponaria TaxID=32244 RepID=A0AAD7PWS7_QUISA|nr:Pentatricopeptide repeat-containing protein family [Quillaja saponaria]
MYRAPRFHGLVRKFMLFPGIHGIEPFFYCNSSIKGIHSLHGCKQKKFISPFYRRNAKPVKSVKKDHVDSKEYMRDTVGKIYRMLKYSTWDSAQEQLEKLPIRWDSYTINQVLKTHPPMEKAWLFFNWASHLRGFKHDQFTYTTMQDIFGEAGRISSMKYVFQQMEEKGIKIDSVTYTSLMHWISNSGDVDGAIKVWEEMKAKGCHPTVVSYTAYMKVLFDKDRTKEATDIYKEMLQSGCAPNCYTYTVLMEYLIGSGRCKEALDIFVKMQEAGAQPDKATCNILIKRCCKVGDTAAITPILLYMKENRLVLRYSVFVEALEALKLAGESDMLLRQVNPHISDECIMKEEANESTKSAADDAPLTIDRGLLLIFLKRRNLVAIDRLLAGMMDKNIPLDPEVISNIIEVNCGCCRTDGALLASKYIVKMGISIDRTSYLSLIGTFTRSTSFVKVVEIVEEMIRTGHYLGIYEASLLIYRLGCARRPTFAVKIFNLLPDDHIGTATYTALISVYFSAGRSDKALEMYKTMRDKGFSPALGTYNVLLGGLERSGRFSEAEHFRKEKKSFQTNCHSRVTVSKEEKICDLLFYVDVLS